MNASRRTGKRERITLAGSELFMEPKHPHRLPLSYGGCIKPMEKPKRRLLFYAELPEANNNRALRSIASVYRLGFRSPVRCSTELWENYAERLA